MDYNRIDLAGIKPGWGSVWQGATVDAAVDDIPGPLMIVTMNRGEVDDQYIDHVKKVDAVLAVWIDDDPNGCLPDDVLRLTVRAVAGWLETGGNVYDHCAAGVSRSSYLDIALHMHILDLDFDQAFALVHAQRPVANPNAGFVLQLRRLGHTGPGGMVW